MDVPLMLDDNLWMNDSYSVKFRNGGLDINLDKDKLLGDVLIEEPTNGVRRFRRGFVLQLLIHLMKSSASWKNWMTCYGKDYAKTIAVKQLIRERNCNGVNIHQKLCRK